MMLPNGNKTSEPTEICKLLKSEFDPIPTDDRVNYEDIRNTIKHYETSLDGKSNVSPFTTEEVKQAVTEIKKTANVISDISLNLFKQCSSLLTPLLIMFNAVLISFTFPDN